MPSSPTAPESTNKRRRARDRLVELVELVKQNPCVIVEELTSRFNVSAQTIRRDFQMLERRGVLIRTYGGAVARVDDQLQFSWEQELRP